MTRSKSDPPVICGSLADRICRGMLPLAESGYALSEQVAAVGFTAHLPWQRFFESFAADELQLREYRTWRVEHAKNIIGRPWPRAMFDRSTTYFDSDYVKMLFERRDRDNGVNEEELSKRYPTQEALWRREPTECDRRRVQLEMQQRDEYERLRAEADAASRLALEREVKQWTADGASRFGDQLECYAAVMELHASKRGFGRDAAKSRKGNPVFSKQIAGEWDLCLAIEQPQVFVAPRPDGLLSLNAELRSRRLAGTAYNLPPDQCLVIRYLSAAPEFGSGYHHFTDLPALETMICAQLALYDLMAPVIEGAIRQSMLH